MFQSVYLPIVHCVMLTDLVDGVIVPTGQRVHTFSISCLRYVPLAQSSHWPVELI